jgi:1,2-diacylglycerol 3-alpha-glucosyltransferase
VLPVMTASEKFAAPVAANMLQKIRDSLGLQPQHKVIVWVGRPIKTKRVPLMLQVFKQVVEQAPDARLLLVGDMALSPDDIPALSRELGIADKVILVGKVVHSDLPAYYHLAQVFAITSAYEGMPRVLGEAAAAGLPMVGMDSAAGVAEFIQDGANGYVCRDGDVQGMAEQLLKLLLNAELSRRLGVAARDLALTRYNAANNADAVVALWQKTVQLGIRN